MTQTKIIDQHKKEIIDYWKLRQEREVRLERDQQLIVQECGTMSPELKELLSQLFAEQRAWREQAEKDELDLLLHAQAMERERHASRQPILSKIGHVFGHRSDRGR
jgi:hypothetical protein